MDGCIAAEYRALMMFDHIPQGCITFPCTDEYFLPHIKPGEFVLVDTKDTTPRDGEVYVIQWQSGRRAICQASKTPSVHSRRPGETDWSEQVQWIVHSLKRRSGKAFTAFLSDARREAPSPNSVVVLPGWSDGWFDTDHLQEKLVGCVVGLYAPVFEEPRRKSKWR